MNTVREIRRLAENKPDTLLFNPLLKDLQVKFADYDEVILKAGQITSVNGKLAERVKKKLIDFIINERDVDPLSRDVQRIDEEITVIL